MNTMNNMKKFASILLALVMVLAIAAPAMADSGTAPATTGSITINNAPDGGTYTLYRIFDLKSFNTDPEAFSYVVSEKWTGFFAEGAAGAEYVTIENGFVTWVDGKNAADFAAAAITYAATNTIANDGQHVMLEAEKGTYTFADVTLGYYLVDSTVGALCGLTTTQPNATVTEKNGAPSIDKDVKEGDDWKDTNDAEIGDTVEFRATIDVEGYASKYVMHDTMSAGLTFGSVTQITLDGSVVDATNYTVKTTDMTDDCTFDVVFTDAFCDTLKSGNEIIVYYNAVVNQKAVIAGTGNLNDVTLSYQDKNGSAHETEKSETKTYTWKLPVFKYTYGADGKKENEDPTPLAGVGFTLYTDSECENAVNLVKSADNVYKVCTKADCDHASHVTEITTDATGKFEIEGLDTATYYLKETTTPAGYNKLDTVVTVVITGTTDSTTGELTGGYTIKADDNEVTQVEVENKTGKVLPETGGMGTTMFYALGSLMIVGAALVLLNKKRIAA